MTRLRQLAIGLCGVGALVLAGVASGTTATEAHAATAPGYVTLLVGRGMYGKMTAG